MRYTSFNPLQALPWLKYLLMLRLEEIQIKRQFETTIESMTDASFFKCIFS